MKICPDCGNNNFYGVGDKIECKECGKDLVKSDHRIDTRPGCGITKKKMMHDEMPWNFTHSD